MTSPKTGSMPRTDTRSVSLSAHGFDVDIAPHFGGRIDRARFAGRDVLLPRRDHDDPDPLGAGCFALVPFSNRIRNGRFNFDGIAHELAPNWTGDDNVIHGEGWQRPWQVASYRADAITLVMESDGWWPWAFECSQTVRLEPGRLDLSLVLTNKAEVAMPAGLGFHPYFPRTAHTRLGFQADAVWAPMGRGKMSAAPLAGDTDFTVPKRLEPLDLDHCFENWRGSALIEQAGSTPSLQIHCRESHRHCVLYVPAGEDHFCFEPVTHLTGAFELDPGIESGLVRLMPNERLEFSMQIAIAPD